MFQSLGEAIPMLLQSYPSIKYGMQGINLGPQKEVAGQMANLSAKQANLADAQYNQDNPYFKQLYNQEQGAQQQDLAAGIAEISRQNRKLSMLGRRPLLDQERGGESIFRQLMQAQQGIGDTSRQNAFKQLHNAQGAVGEAGQSYGNLYNSYGGLANPQYQNNQQKVGAYSSIGELLKGLFNL